MGHAEVWVCRSSERDTKCLILGRDFIENENWEDPEGDGLIILKPILWE
jgi:hypothetical protein